MSEKKMKLSEREKQNIKCPANVYSKLKINNITVSAKSRKNIIIKMNVKM